MSAATPFVTEGLRLLRSSYGYTETVRKYAKAGLPFGTSAMGKAEAAFMVTPITRESLDRGLRELRSSWGYTRTRFLNPFKFSASAMGRAEAQFVKALELTPLPGNPFGVLNGVQAINPRGGDDAQATFDAGFRIAAANVGDYPYTEWAGAGWFSRHERLGIRTALWQRCYLPEHCDSLCRLALAGGHQLVIHNIEKELETTCPPAALAQVVKRYPNLYHSLQPEPWVPNNVRLEQIADLGVVLLTEAYLNADPRFLPSVLADHARDQGAREVSATFGAGTWSDAQLNVAPSVYLADWSGPYFVYPIDSKNPRAWRRGA